MTVLEKDISSIDGQLCTLPGGHERPYMDTSLFVSIPFFGLWVQLLTHIRSLTSAFLFIPLNKAPLNLSKP